MENVDYPWLNTTPLELLRQKQVPSPSLQPMLTLKEEKLVLHNKPEKPTFVSSITEHSQLHLHGKLASQARSIVIKCRRQGQPPPLLCWGRRLLAASLCHSSPALP